MSNNQTVSVVIPVYNVEKYLDRCIESVINQTYQNLEIILVDDGSPDRCPQMCDMWAEKDSRIKVVHKKNEGLGMARNTGIACATGEYICFLDSDDYIDLQVIEKAIRLADSTESDIVLFGMTLVDARGRTTAILPPKTVKQVYMKEEVKGDLLPNLLDSSNPSVKAENLCMSMCTNLFRMELIRKANWQVVSEREIISEDYYSMLVLYNCVQKVAVLPEAAYYYCSNSSSLSHTYREDRFLQVKKFYNSALCVAEENNYGVKVEEQLKRVFLGLSSGAIKQIVLSHNRFIKKVRFLTEIVWDDTIQRVLKSTCKENYTKKQRLFYWLVKKKCVFLVYVLAKLQAEKDRILQG